MILNRLFSWERTGTTSKGTGSDPRSGYRRDFDRIVFSSPFRRLQNKTQVFPLPGTVFVHNRLTHSLEVASVGRSLGSLIGEYIIEKYKSELNQESKDFYKHDLPEVISAGCLCHDIGNPSFGHSGEDAIADFFVRNEQNQDIKKYFTDKEWCDFSNFEGNANAIRILAGQQSGKSPGGLGLTYSTLSAIIKYPCESIAKNKNKIYQNKFGFFQSETDIFMEIAHKTNMLCDNSNKHISYFRHPFVWLIEIADDICYNIIDLEDAHRLRIIDHIDCKDTFIQVIKALGVDSIENINNRLNKIEDKNDKIAFLRAKSINALIYHSVELYKKHFEQILNGELNSSIFDLIKINVPALQLINTFSIKNIYNHRSVVEIENAGYHVMYELLNHFIPPILKDKKERKNSENKAIQLIPQQFLYENNTHYYKVLGVLDYISGMTDNYAVDLYKKIRGINMGMNVIL